MTGGRGHQVGEAESHSEETPAKRETAGEARERARRLRAQAALAWLRVQRVIRLRKTGAPSAERLLETVDRIPSASYLIGIGTSLVASAWLFARGRRTESIYLGFSAPLLLAVALYLKARRRSRRL